MKKTQLDEAIKSIGKKSFVEDYEVYSNSNLSKEEKVNELSKKYSRNGSLIRVSFAEKIFGNSMQLEALNLIVTSPRVSEEIKHKAKNIIINNYK
ncbi:hypothetical protein V7112_08560 [Bacillus sp. JJ1566]|uniref:hypothetical protein n=1 Tax=Bacillus sp. JJ1566 TaxID=3122961 RepID=UPI003000BB11